MEGLEQNGLLRRYTMKGEANINRQRNRRIDEDVPKITEDTQETERMGETYRKIKAELERQDAEVRREQLLAHEFEESYFIYGDSLCRGTGKEDH